MPRVRLNDTEVEVSSGADLVEAIKRTARERGIDSFLVRLDDRLASPDEVRNCKVEEVREVRIQRYYRAG
jgi:hypothetical protein